jgi:hypothetical protein
MPEVKGHGTGTPHPSVLRKDDFLSDPAIQDFIGWMRSQLDQELPGSIESWWNSDGSKSDSFAEARPVPPFHVYLHRKPSYWWWCYNLIDAAAKYRFPIERHIGDDSLIASWGGHETLAANAGVLSRLERRLRAAVVASRKMSGANKLRFDKTAADVATAIQRWGGTDGAPNGKGNVSAIRDLHSGGRSFCDYLELCRQAFGAGRILDLRKFVGTPYTMRSNAGFTKIYSLLFNDFIIYDSRVAAALGMFVLRYSRHRHLPSIPVALEFCWMPGRGGGLRDPSNGPWRFPKCRNGTSGHAQHIDSNVRANWLLAACVNGSRFEQFVDANPYIFPVKPLRALEAALFMIGYDLAGNDPYPSGAPQMKRRR